MSDPGVGGNGAGDGSSASDLAAAVPADLGAVRAADLSTSVGDLASGGHDLATACLPTGGSCPNHDDAICCSHFCIYATNTCK